MTTYEPPLDLFAAQIESIKAQTHADWICLISDDCSSAGIVSRRCVGSIGERSPLRPSRARATGWASTANYERVLGMVPPAADLVALADQDDRWYPEKLEALIAALGDRDLVYGDMRIVGEDGAADLGYVLEPAAQQLQRSRLAAGREHGHRIGRRCSGRICSTRALPFPPRRSDGYHDHWIALVAMTGRGLAYVDRPLQDYVQHGGAAQGHEQANAGASYLQLRLLVVLAWQGLWALLGRHGARGLGQPLFRDVRAHGDLGAGAADAVGRLAHPAAGEDPAARRPTPTARRSRCSGSSAAPCGRSGAGTRPSAAS